MERGRMTVVFAVLFFATLLTAGAEERYGIKVYSGAKHDAAVSKMVSETMSVNAVCYRTGDSVGNVTAFYKKQAGLTYVGGNAEGALFQKGDIDITIQNPWMDLKTGKMMKDTLISIVKK